MYQHIMVPLDGSELAECVLPHLESIVKKEENPRVSLIRVVTPLHMYQGVEAAISLEERQRLEADSMDIARKYLDQVTNRLAASGIKAEPSVLFGNVIEELVNFETKNGVDLTIIATHGRSGVSRLVLGGIADKILRSSCVPVLMVRVPGCVPGV